MLCAALDGTVKFCNAVNFEEEWKQTNEQRKAKNHICITTMDFSEKMGLLALGGAEGMLMLLDPLALGIMGCSRAHTEEIIGVYFYAEQLQIITVAIDRTICIWDANRLEVIQSFKDKILKCLKFTSTCFDTKRGILFTGCQMVKLWRAEVDPDLEVKAL